jgi:hypothetical protein
MALSQLSLPEKLNKFLNNNLPLHKLVQFTLNLLAVVISDGHNSQIYIISKAFLGNV